MAPPPLNSAGDLKPQCRRKGPLHSDSPPAHPSVLQYSDFSNCTQCELLKRTRLRETFLQNCNKSLHRDGGRWVPERRAAPPPHRFPSSCKAAPTSKGELRVLRDREDPGSERGRVRASQPATPPLPGARPRQERPTLRFRHCQEGRVVSSDSA